MVTTSQASSPLNFHDQLMVSFQKPFALSAALPEAGSPVARQPPMSSWKPLRASLESALGSSTNRNARITNGNISTSMFVLADEPPVAPLLSPVYCLLSPS